MRTLWLVVVGLALPVAGWAQEAGLWQQVYTGGTYDAYMYRNTRRMTAPAAFSATVGYQFFDNVFVHPYVLGGLRAASVSDTTDTWSATEYRLLSIETGPSKLLARPVVGGGFKSYFDNGRAFIRSELLMSLEPGGSAHAVLRIGAGVDF